MSGPSHPYAALRQLYARHPQLARLLETWAPLRQLAEQWCLLRALYVVSYTTDGPAEKVAVEFLHAAGDVFGGRLVADLPLHLLSREGVRRELEDGDVS